MKLCNDKSMTGMLFADVFVGVSDSRENLQKLIDVVLVIGEYERLMKVRVQSWALLKIRKKGSGSGENIECVAIDN